MSGSSLVRLILKHKIKHNNISVTHTAAKQYHQIQHQTKFDALKVEVSSRKKTSLSTEEPKPSHHRHVDKMKDRYSQ